MHVTKIGIMAGAALSLALAIGCGSSVETNPGGGGNGGTSHGGSGPGGACAAFMDETGQGPVTVTFRNNSGLPVYLPMGCTEVQYDMVAVGGSSPGTLVYDPSCLQTCEDHQTQPSYACGACLDMARRIDDGETYTTTWSGTALGSVSMPASCWYEGTAAGTCSQIFAAPANTYEIHAIGYISSEGDCSGDGLCGGPTTGAQAYATPATFNYPAQKSVEVVFDTCAFGCP